MCISAYLLAGRVLRLPDATAFALKSLDRVLSTAWTPDGLAHVVAYEEATSAPTVAGVLDDYAALASAALDAWETTSELHYLTVARQIVDTMLQHFCDLDEGGTTCHGFFDTDRNAEAIGALRAKRKPIQDSPTPSHALTGDERYRTLAMTTLETFAGIVEHFGLYAASYGLALRRALEPTVKSASPASTPPPAN
jgi:uncharacterized protein YyaL (SSP411 family)